METLPADKTPSLATPSLAPSGFTGQLGAFTVAAKPKVLASSPKKGAGRQESGHGVGERGYVAS